MNRPVADPLYHKLIENLDEPTLIRMTADLIALPSYRGIEGQETAAAEYLYRFFKRVGIETALHPVLPGRCNVSARLPGNGCGPALLLTSHLDTVPPYEMADALQPRLEDGFLYGRGAADAKAAIVCMAAALAALHRCGVKLNGNLLFTGVIDEEEGSAGTRILLEKGLSVDAAIVGEPTGFDLCLGHRGLIWLECGFLGRTVHGGSQEKVLNTIIMAARFIRRLEDTLVPELARRIHPRVGAASLNYGMIRGGTQPSTVPGECLLQIDRRWIPGEEYRSVIAELQQILDSLQEEDPRFQASLKVIDDGFMAQGWVHRPAVLDPAHPLVDAASDAVFKTVGLRPSRRSFTAWSDAGILNGYGGIPTLVFAPGELEHAHTSRERIEVATLLPAAMAYALTAARFCGCSPWN